MAMAAARSTPSLISSLPPPPPHPAAARPATTSFLERPAATPIASRSWTTARWRGSRRQRRVMAGASSGIGAETARGAHVVMAVRNLAAAEAVRQAVLAETPDASVEVMELDLSSLAFVRKFAPTSPPVASRSTSSFRGCQDEVQVQAHRDFLGPFIQLQVKCESMSEAVKHISKE
ncbi:short-chain dehydrogenase TIC 32, chloroplastic-like isoform X2 [Triticum urartu]|uniref:short-chain dehydrogenase TIC 32, chloroplastic-like isoform X2 n=1 Tax=Triticum urartu TaxID=4572 RepID=UPI002043154B|nr:short-chain dehydrogenase TIC 32, chloroplastic-like isoform X2 [Triticum urartu]XP_048568546.1 short-chain dehydrogenase TIC 32, chloroplastic-like isoform X2 [Triticum urartu]